MDTNSNDSKVKTDKKEKLLLPTKVIIRRLPPSMTQELFIEQISPLPEHDYLYFVKPDMSLGPYAFSRVYINFLSQQDILIFRDKFDGYVFVDSKGGEYPAVVEFAQFQKIPKRKNKKDAKSGTIEQDPDYIKFVESWNNPEEVSLPSAEFYLEEIETREREMRANNGDLLSTTPLIEFLRQKRAEKQRIRDEKREERRRRDLEKKRIKEEERRRRKLEREKDREKLKDKEKSPKDSEEKSSYKSSKEPSVKLLKNPDREKEKSDSADKRDNSETFQRSRVNSGDSHAGESHYSGDDRRTSDSKFRNKDKFKDRKDRNEKFGRAGNQSTSSSKLANESRRGEEDGNRKSSSFSSSKKSTGRGGKSYERSRESIAKSREARVTFDCPESKSSTAQKLAPKASSSKEKQKPADYEASSSKDEAAQQPKSGEANSQNDEGSTSSKKKSGRSSKENKSESRIRNKDRPSMEIYRPGMRRLSLQRNSPAKESPSSSSSPSPTTSQPLEKGEFLNESGPNSPTEEQAFGDIDIEAECEHQEQSPPTTG